MRSYTGIGSRSTPEAVLVLMEETARRLDRAGYVLRSGHAPGADYAFEQGAGAHAEIYLPWAGFRREVPIVAEKVVSRPSSSAFQIARRYHPSWPILRPSGRAMHARNAHQVLGEKLDDPADFVICWTADGSLDGERSKSGGTGQALRIATGYSVPVYNLGNERAAARLEELIGELCPS